MQIEKLNLSTLICFHCNWEPAKHKCKLQLSDDIFITVCLCDICVKRDETELRMKFSGTKNKTVKQAAKILGVSEGRVRQFIYTNRLPAEKVGRDLLIKTHDLEKFALIRRETGRPVNQKKELKP